MTPQTHGQRLASLGLGKAPTWRALVALHMGPLRTTGGAQASECCTRPAQMLCGPVMPHGSLMYPPLVEFRQLEALSRRYPANTTLLSLQNVGGITSCCSGGPLT